MKSNINKDFDEKNVNKWKKIPFSIYVIYYCKHLITNRNNKHLLIPFVLLFPKTLQLITVFFEGSPTNILIFNFYILYTAHLCSMSHVQCGTSCCWPSYLFVLSGHGIFSSLFLNKISNSVGTTSGSCPWQVVFGFLSASYIQSSYIVCKTYKQTNKTNKSWRGKYSINV